MKVYYQILIDLPDHADHTEPFCFCLWSKIRDMCYPFSCPKLMRNHIIEKTLFSATIATPSNNFWDADWLHYKPPDQPTKPNSASAMFFQSYSSPHSQGPKPSSKMLTNIGSQRDHGFCAELLCSKFCTFCHLVPRVSWPNFSQK
jgi:hypothetical protein